MAEYIDKQRAKDLMGCCLASAKAEYKAANDVFTKARFGDYISAIQSMIDVVESVEAADVQPVRRGEWQQDGATHKRCSNCKKFLVPNLKSSMFAYCPNCGARMDGDTE